MNLCAGRGKFPIKFNGSIFTFLTSPDQVEMGYDYRNWGGQYWFQNTRLIYWNALLAGDFELMKSFFDLYLNIIPIAEYRCREYFNHEGIHIPEVVSFFGLFDNGYWGYGMDRTNKPKNYVENRYIRYHINGMLEFSFMIIKYYVFTNDVDFFLRSQEFIYKVLTFYRQHFECIDGKLFFHPTSALETWQDCCNDTPTIAGLLSVCTALKKLSNVKPDLEKLSQEILDILPEIPIKQQNGQSYIAPFETNIDLIRRNGENPELYCIFPYGLFLENEEDLAIAKRTYQNRDNKVNSGWTQDLIQAALLGLRNECYNMLYERSCAVNPDYVFPAFWGPNCDWVPDQDHGTSASAGLILTLLQSKGENAEFLPAWPKNVDVAFKLPLENGGWAVCKYECGEIVESRIEESKMKIVLKNEKK